MSTPPVCARCKQQPPADLSIYCVACRALELHEFHVACTILSRAMARLCREAGDEAAAARIEKGMRR